VFVLGFCFVLRFRLCASETMDPPGLTGNNMIGGHSIKQAGTHPHDYETTDEKPNPMNGIVPIIQGKNPIRQVISHR